MSGNYQEILKKKNEMECFIVNDFNINKLKVVFRYGLHRINVEQVFLGISDNVYPYRLCRR